MNNTANREVCDVDIRALDTKAPVMFFEYANTTTQSFTGDNKYAMAKGAKKISFSDPLDGTATIEAQIAPMELYALLSDGVVESTALRPIKTSITCTTAGALTIHDDVVAGTVFVYPSGKYGDSTVAVKGTFASGTFTAKTPGDIAVSTAYDVAYIVNLTTGVAKVSFNNSKLPKAYYIAMNTYNKGFNNEIIPYQYIFYKAVPQRKFDLSQSSEGDPMKVTLTFDLMEDAEGNYVDMIEVTE